MACIKLWGTSISVTQAALGTERAGLAQCSDRVLARQYNLNSDKVKIEQFFSFHYASNILTMLYACFTDRTKLSLDYIVSCAISRGLFTNF